ncbi:MAG: DUF2799 domain-containing protein [Bdellovibrionales bacterium]|nr:DUF2799 domain-containing protein [Bdellovibrionales bacterium]
MRHFIAGFLVLLTVGCSNWALKERCEKTNWFNYSQQVAFEGKYLEEDGFVKACKKLDLTSAVQLDLGFKQGREKMCQYDEIYARAKEGVPVFFKFCDGLEMNQMKSLYQKGLLTYCTKEKGYTFGKAGKIYQNLCSPEQEKVFLPGFYQGRREYLTSYIAEQRASLDKIKALEAGYAQTERNLQSEYSTLPSNAQECHSQSVYNESSKQNEYKTVCEEAFYIRSRRSDLWSKMDDIRSRLSELRNDWRETDESIKKAQVSLNELP